MKYRDGQMILVQVLAERVEHFRRAGFNAHALQLRRDDGSLVVADLWTQDPPSLADYLNAALLLFDDEPGSLDWEEGAGLRSRRD